MDAEEPLEQAAGKRKAEEEPAGEGGDAQPAAKEAKAEEDTDAAADNAAEPAAEAEAAPAAEAAEPVTIGYKTFATGKEALSYFQGLIQHLRKYQQLNDVSEGCWGWLYRLLWRRQWRRWLLSPASIECCASC